MKLLCASAVVCALLFSPVEATHAQFFATCDTGSHKELERSLIQHSEHIKRLEMKYASGFYRQGPLPPDFKPVSHMEILLALQSLEPRRAALLFFAFQDRPFSPKGGRLCSWLMSPHVRGQFGFVSKVVDLSYEELSRLQPNIVKSLGVIALAGNKMPTRKNETIPVSDPAETRYPNRVLYDTASVLLPSNTLSVLRTSKIDTLIVLPVFELGTIPFAALPVDANRVLNDLVSITVAPGAFVFRSGPRRARTTFPDALVVAHPRTEFGDEASSIANLLGAIAGADTKAQMYGHLKAKPRTSLIYIAAHGRADEENPNDGSFVRLRDGAITGREITSLSMRSSKRSPTVDAGLRTIAKERPLVVLSACQTGLGKIFDVGNIGLARAWHQAGASNVVMSLWSVYDRSTQELTSAFVSHLRNCPPDKALGAAMRQLRNAYPKDPAKWAGFAVFGLPESPATVNQTGPGCDA